MNKQNKGWIKLKNWASPKYLKDINDFLEFFSPISRIKTQSGVHVVDASDSSSDHDDDFEHDANVLGANVEMVDDTQTYSMLHDMHQSLNMDGDDVFDNPMSSHANINEESNKEAKKFYNLLKDIEQKLYPSCHKFSKLSFIMHLFHVKCLYGWSNTSFDSLLKLLVEAFFQGNVLPNSTYDFQKIIKDLEPDYVKIDACIDDCIWYRGGYENLDECPICKKSR